MMSHSTRMASMTVPRSVTKKELCFACAGFDIDEDEMDDGGDHCGDGRQVPQPCAGRRGCTRTTRPGR